MQDPVVTPNFLVRIGHTLHLVCRSYSVRYQTLQDLHIGQRSDRTPPWDSTPTIPGESRRVGGFKRISRRVRGFVHLSWDANLILRSLLSKGQRLGVEGVRCFVRTPGEIPTPVSHIRPRPGHTLPPPKTCQASSPLGIVKSSLRRRRRDSPTPPPRIFGV